MKKLLITLAAALMLVATAVPAMAATLDTSKAEVVGDVRFDYQFVTQDNKNVANFELNRARLGATTTFDEGGGALIFQYQNGAMDLQYAYVEAYPLGNASAKLGGIIGRQYTMFGLTKDLDRFQPLGTGPIEEKYISAKQDGVTAIGTVGKTLLGALQYHNGVSIDSTEYAEKDWNAYARLQPCKYFYLSSSFMQNVHATDYMSEVVGVEVGPVEGSLEHLSSGEGYSFNFGDRLDEFSATLGVGVGQSRKVTLLGRADWFEGEKASYYVGTNWSVKDQVFLQANALLNPQMELVDNIVKLRAVVLFN